MSEPTRAPASRPTELIERGKPTYGVDLGVILLDADFPRPVGDIAHGHTLPFPVHYEPTRGAPVPHVVEEAAHGLLDRFVDSGRRLLERGARLLTTSCGFLAIYQRELPRLLDAPVATSSLLQIPLLLRILPPGGKLCLVTVNSSTLDERHFDGAGIDPADRERLRVVGLEDGDHFYPVVVGQDGPLDVARAEDEVVAVCRKALADDPSIGAFVFECTNLPPYAPAVRNATGLPVWDAITMAHWLQAGAAGPPTR
ncbi:aspartate/glutamate racemase family protein [Streptomyces sp. AJS327]|uniref:aspartate/glutamate racemase family protein n=1 Tax=Streptomyces sp. AJS327 TaxID=2545265 RepID=UPI0015DD57E8|nr:aspartate/glutamate racemase family protein [Streptomyces sp. AJS327]MBA0050175.1 aspartate/glutamate racemase family protein [Streptomyces sp. AJS327]